MKWIFKYSDCCEFVFKCCKMSRCFTSVLRWAPTKRKEIDKLRWNYFCSTWLLVVSLFFRSLFSIMILPSVWVLRNWQQVIYRRFFIPPFSEVPWLWCVYFYSATKGWFFILAVYYVSLFVDWNQVGQIIRGSNDLFASFELKFS